MELESIASVGVLVANGIFIVVSVASYLRMNSHEMRRQQYIHHALKETRESGHELKGAAKALIRLLDRLERSDSWRKTAPMELAPPEPSSSQVQYGEEPDEGQLQAPNEVHKLSTEAYDEWRRLQQRELERVLMQRRRLLHDVHDLQGRVDDAQRQAQQWRSKHDALLRERKQWQAQHQELSQTRESLAQYKSMLDTAEKRLDEVVQASERLQAELTQQQRSQERDASADNLMQRIKALEASLHRNQVEKQFIEDHLLRLDANERSQRAGQDRALALDA